MKKVEKPYRLHIGSPIEWLGADPPPWVGTSFTVGKMIVQLIPGAASTSTDHAVRLWRIGMEMDAATSEYLDLSELDFKLLENVLKAGERPVWVQVNLGRVFDEAKAE
jgi:hypothetical protein